MNRLTRNILILMVSMLVSSNSYASLVFAFNEVGGNVTMTASGVLNTNNLVARTTVDSWSGTGIEENGNNDILGGTSFGQVNASFAFNDGTDFSAWESATGPWSQSNFGWTVDAGGTTSFTTYVRSDDGAFRQIPGFGLRVEDLVGGFWTANQNWTLLNTSFVSLGLVSGIYTVTDFLTSESITIAVGEVPVVPLPAAAWLFGTGILGLMAARRRSKKFTA